MKLLRIIKLLPRCHHFLCSSKYLFVLSHMRSRSSVLSHILGSNNDIIGYGELSRSYKKNFDLFKMKIALNEDIKTNLCKKYLYDKLLHNSYKIDDQILSNPDVKFVFLLRKPEGTIKSILNMGFKIQQIEYQSEKKVFDYYINRLKELEVYAEKLKGKYLFIKSDDLVDNTDITLDAFSNWLKLRTPLSKEYNTFARTGTPGHGDPLENIHSGVLKKTKPHDIELSPELLEKADIAYENCLKKLLENKDISINLGNHNE